MSPIVMLEVALLGVLSLAALALGIGMAYRPSQRRYEALRPVTVAMIFGSLWIMGTGLTNMLMGASRSTMPVSWQAVAGGIAEMLVPGILATAVLTVAWGLTAIGLRKLA